MKSFDFMTCIDEIPKRKTQPRNEYCEVLVGELTMSEYRERTLDETFKK